MDDDSLIDGIKEVYIIDGYKFTEFILYGTLQIVARKWDPKLENARLKSITVTIAE